MRTLRIISILAALLVCCALAVGCNVGDGSQTTGDGTTTTADTTVNSTSSNTESTAPITGANTETDESTTDETTNSDTTANDGTATTEADTTVNDGTDTGSVTTGEGTVTTDDVTDNSETADTTDIANTETTTTEKTTTDEVTTTVEEVTNHPDATDKLVLALNSDKTAYSVIDLGDCTDKDVVIPAKVDGIPVVSISAKAFADEKEITSVFIPDTVTHIGSSAFENCFGLTSVIFSARLESIGDSAFADCPVLNSIIIPKTVENIGKGAFAGCTGLASIKVEIGNNTYSATNNCLIETEINTLIAGSKTSVIPDGVVVNAESAFARSFSLSKINIPESVKVIGANAFSGCVQLKTINYAGNEAGWSEIQKGKGWDDSIISYNVVCAK